MDWFRSLLQGLLCLWCTTSSWRTFAFWQALHQRYLDSSFLARGQFHPWILFFIYPKHLFLKRKTNDHFFWNCHIFFVLLLALLLYLFVFCTSEAVDLLFLWWKTSAFEAKAFSKYEEMVEKVNWLGSVSWVSPWKKLVEVYGWNRWF